MGRAKLVETPTGLVADGPGWFILNAGDGTWETTPAGGAWLGFEPPDGPRNPIGVGLHRLGPGETTGLYHEEGDQEGFLVLEGECLAIIDGAEHRLRRWDYFHCPAGTPHIIVGGEEPATLFMLGGRTPGAPTRYLVDDAAARRGASVTTPADTSSEAYAGRDRTTTPIRAPWPAQSPAG